MRVLVSGASGFVASYLVPELKRAGHEVLLTAPHHDVIDIAGTKYPCLPCDLRQSSAVHEMIKKCGPDAIVHLGAISHVAKAEQNRDLLSEVNIVGTHNLCAAASRALPETIFLYASTSLVYGSQATGGPCSEKTPPAPEGAYAHSKLAAESVVHTFESAAFKAYCVRPFNHIGPGQSSDFVCTAFARRVYDAAASSSIPVGNLGALRDFSDVRDVVRAYRLILEKKPSSSLFVLGSGQLVSIRSVLDYFVKISEKRIEVVVDPSLLRPFDQKASYADASLAAKELGWQPRVDLETTLRDIYTSIQIM